MGAITAVHPEIISILLDRVQETIDQVGMVSVLTVVIFFNPEVIEQWQNWKVVGNDGAV